VSPKPAVEKNRSAETTPEVVATPAVVEDENARLREADLAYV